MARPVRLAWDDHIWSEFLHSPERARPNEEPHPIAADHADGYYARVALDEGETILTLDDDFGDVDGVPPDIILAPEEFATLNE